MKKSIVLDYENKTELTFTFSLAKLKDAWPHQSAGDEWEFIENICEAVSERAARPLFNLGFIIKQRLNLAETNGIIELLTVSIQIVSGQPQLDISLLTDSLSKDSLIDGLISLTYRDKFNNLVAL